MTELAQHAPIPREALFTASVVLYSGNPKALEAANQILDDIANDHGKAGIRQASYIKVNAPANMQFAEAQQGNKAAITFDADAATRFLAANVRQV
jgi:hemoglobin-like flavoprotein